MADFLCKILGAVCSCFFGTTPHVQFMSNDAAGRDFIAELDDMADEVQRNQQEWFDNVKSLGDSTPPSTGTWIEEQHRNLEMLWSEAVNMNIQSLKDESASEKALVVERLSWQGPPSRFRLIDCKSTYQQKRVILVNGHQHQGSYTAISHTWGQAVYDVFDCQCACKCSGDVPARCSGNTCPGAVASHGEEHQKVVGDILKMCERLMEAGAGFVWHDGVCIAQYDDAEVEETIRHMGWIYANASDTVIFLDYIGNPIALLDPRVYPRPDQADLKPSVQTRWNTRVWTVQEAILSKRRRYCIRCVDTREVAVDNSRSYTRNLVRFISKLSCAYHDSRIAVIEEEALWDQVLSLLGDIRILCEQVFSLYPGHFMLNWYFQLLSQMMLTICSWITVLKEELFTFPSLAKVLKECAMYRESKWKGDRINGVLGLAGITDFVAPKNGSLQNSTIEFLKRLGQQDLGEALFWVNMEDIPPTEESSVVHTWVVCISRPFSSLCMHLRKGKKPVGFGCDTEAAHTCDELWCKYKPEDVNEDCLLAFFEGVTNEEAWPFSSSLLHQPALSSLKAIDRGCDDLIKYKVLENGMLELRGTLLCIPVHFNVVGKELPGAPKQLSDCFSLAIDLFVGISACPRYVAFANYPSMILGAAMISFRSDQQPGSLTRPVVQGKVMHEGDSFSAHLVLAEFHHREQLLCWRPLLIVHGNGDSKADCLQVPVSRLGFFLAYDNLIRLIRIRHAHCFTRVLDRLVIQ